MGVLAQDSLIRPDQSGLGLASDGINTWVTLRGSSAYAISSNKGTVANSSGQYNVAACGTGTTTDGEESFYFIMANSGDSFGLTLRYVDSNNFYYADLGNSGQFVEIGKDVAGSFSTIGSAAFSWSVGTRYGMRFRVTGTALALRVWNADTSPEPTTWNVSVTDSSISSAGRICISCNPASSSAIKFDTFLTTDGVLSLTDTATTTEVATFQGTESASESVATSEQASSQGTAAIIDTASVQDSAIVPALLSATESASSSEIATAQANISLLDTAASSDLLSLTSLFSISETVLSVSSPNAQGSASSNASSIATELTLLLASLSILDASQAIELASLPTLYTISDTSQSTDSISFALPISASAIHITWITRDMNITWRTRS